MDSRRPHRNHHRNASSHAAASTSHPNSKFRSNPTNNFNPNTTRNRDSSSTSQISSENRGAGARNNKIGSQRALTEQEDGEDLSDAPSIIGTCPFMCPVRERAQRECLRDLAVFERLDGNPGRTSPSLAVKKFCRTISMKHVDASDVRPLPVTRSIRQDLSMQNIANDQAIWMYEKMVNFHIISHHKLRRCGGDDTTISSMHHLNMEQLTKSLASLYNLYDINRNSDSIYEKEAEFRSLFVLLHLGSHNHLMGESLSLWFRRLPPSIYKSKEMCFARSVLRFFRLGNFWRFFYTISAEATYMQFSILEPYIIEVRAEALACINYAGYKLHPYPLECLSKILKMMESDLEDLCGACGLEISVDDVGNKVLAAKQTSFRHPKGGFQNYDFVGLEQLERESKAG
ncbi:hypothetical protein Ancab_023883 [Ancistrocladus abbreviatus]